MRRCVALILMVALMPMGAASQAQCSWPAKFDADTMNIAFPDSNARYWVARYVAAPGTALRIHGAFPDARYISLHAYDEAQRPIGSLADIELDPDPGSENPFRSQVAAGGTYTAHVVFEPAPYEPEPNTIYAAETVEGQRNPSGSLIYRLYVPDDPSDDTGGGGVPDVTLVTADGAIEVPFQRCDSLPPSAGGGPTHVIADASFPDEVPRALPYPPAEDPPVFRRFYCTECSVLERFPSNPVTDAVPRSEGGFLSNQHIAYLFSLFARTYGDLFVFRMRVPTFPDTRAGEEPSAAREVRYWSVCQNELATQRFVACIADYQAHVGPDGVATFVISDPDDKPGAHMDGVNWLPWGGVYYDGNVIYRHMLPSPSFAQAIQNVPVGTPPAAIMGEYVPRAAYCDQATFEAGGPDACLTGL